MKDFNPACVYCGQDCAPDARVCPKCGQRWPRRTDRRERPDKIQRLLQNIWWQVLDRIEWLWNKFWDLFYLMIFIAGVGGIGLWIIMLFYR